MKKLAFIIPIFLIAILLLFFFKIITQPRYSTPVQKKSDTIKSHMKLTSPAFSQNSPIPAKYTCKGQDVNPPLSISDVPDTAKSLVLILDDPDAPGKTWVHWVLYNIDPSVQNINENSVPSWAKLGMTDFGQPKYGGPCPPSGTHRYYFKLYAIDTMLNISDHPTKQQIEENIKDHIVGQAELMGTFSKSQ